MIRTILAWWHATQRRMDLTFLWPACKSAAPDMDHAKAAFALHAHIDPAWAALGEDEIYRRIEALT